MSISLAQLKPSQTIEYNGEPYVVLTCEHAKLARGSSFVRAKLKNLITARIIDSTLRDSDKITPAFIEKKSLTFSYREADHYHFLDNDTYEDFILDKNKIETETKYLKENLEIAGLFYQNKLISLELPPSVNLKVTDTEPGFKGDTRKAGTKPATLETGLIVDVPLFIEKGDYLKIDTRNQSYLERA